MNAIITLLLPPALMLAFGFALRVAAKDKASRFAVLPLAIATLLPWALIVRPGWIPVDDIRRIIHIAVGAAALGLVLDFVQPRRLFAALLGGGFVLGAAFASVTGRLALTGPITVTEGLMTGGLAIAAFLILARFDAMRTRPLSLALLLMLITGGLAVLAAIAQDAALAGLALVLACALVGLVVFTAVAGAESSDGIILLAGAATLAMIWALIQRHPEMGLALLVMPLVLFAEATARRVPLPAARISTVLYPLVFAAFASLPLVLAALIAFVTSRP